MTSIKTVSDMMKALQEEIEAVKAGTLSESAARMVFRGRDLQLKTATLNLQFQRLNKGVKPATEMPLIGGPEQGSSTEQNTTK